MLRVSGSCPLRFLTYASKAQRRSNDLVLRAGAARRVIELNFPERIRSIEVFYLPVIIVTQKPLAGSSGQRTPETVVI